MIGFFNKGQNNGRDTWSNLSRERTAIFIRKSIGTSGTSSSSNRHIGSVSKAPMWILGGSFKGIFWFAQRPTATLNTGDYYFDVTRGCMLVTDGTGAWFNPISPALPPL